MKKKLLHLKSIYEYYDQFDMISKDDFIFNTENVDVDIVGALDEDIDHIDGVANVEWMLNFDFKNNLGVEIIPVINRITCFLKVYYYDENNNIDETFEEVVIDKEDFISIDYSEDDETNKNLYYPIKVELNYRERKAVVYF